MTKKSKKDKAAKEMADTEGRLQAKSPYVSGVNKVRQRFAKSDLISEEFKDMMTTLRSRRHKEGIGAAPYGPKPKGPSAIPFQKRLKSGNVKKKTKNKKYANGESVRAARF
jgi:hypothetical protein